MTAKSKLYKCERAVHVLTLCMFVFQAICPLSSATAEIPNHETREQKTLRFVQKWQEVFGPVDFAQEETWDWMIAVHPQPPATFAIFADEKLSENITDHHQLWLQKVLKGKFLATLTNLPPSKFYLNQGRVESSLLYYQLEFENNIVFIQESYKALLLTIKPSGFDPRFGIEGKFLGRILFEWVNLNKLRPDPPAISPRPPNASGQVELGSVDVVNPFTVPYDSAAELLEAFKLPPQLKVGETFGNSFERSAYPPLANLHYWQSYVVGFVGTNGVSLFLFKADRPGDPRIGFPHDFNWLNKGLFRADGKTLVDPPRSRNINESSDLDPSRLK